ncbi:MAG: monovalent cation/H(+) antiporter subunit G [Candidatus Schekmanbacteria bacterium]|nr:monovalent cation/H(+) antiporter subunit G [Candidatus Schekmanbacteria bacterium]
MLRIIINSLVIPLVALGTFFFIIGTLGLMRFPDSYSRIHATTKCDTFGAGSILTALALYDPLSMKTLKLLVIFVLVFAYSPTAGHLLARVAFRKGRTPWRKKLEIKYRNEMIK